MNDADTDRRADGKPMTLVQIGTIWTPYRTAAGTPIQPVFGQDAEATVELREEYAAALADVEGFERIWLIYWLDRAGPYTPRVVPYRDHLEHGLFATRSPTRPNPVGLSVVRLVDRRGAILRVTGVDILDGTPLLDIKPYVPAFDAHAGSKAGWFDLTSGTRTVADGRFSNEE